MATAGKTRPPGVDPDVHNWRAPAGAGAMIPAPTGVLQLKAAARLAGIEMDAAVTAEKAANARFEAGLCPMSDLSEARARRERAEVALQTAQQLVSDAERIERLAMPIDIDLKDAPIPSVARLIETVGGLTVRVAPELQAGPQRVTAKARGVAVATVLENIGVAARLTIAPDDSGGILLRPAPSLQIGGKTVPQTEPHAPWSPEWDRYPEPALPLGTIRGWRSPIAASRPSLDAARSAPQLVEIGAQVSVAAAGEGQFVVAERGVAPDGRPCVALSLYRITRGRMHCVDTVFHRLTQPAARAKTAPKPR